jgi:hypothetical protein
MSQFTRQASRTLTCVGFAFAILVLVPIVTAADWVWPRPPKI